MTILFYNKNRRRSTPHHLPTDSGYSLVYIPSQRSIILVKGFFVGPEIPFLEEHSSTQIHPGLLVRGLEIPNLRKTTYPPCWSSRVSKEHKVLRQWDTKVLNLQWRESNQWDLLQFSVTYGILTHLTILSYSKWSLRQFRFLLWWQRFTFSILIGFLL